MISERQAVDLWEHIDEYTAARLDLVRLATHESVDRLSTACMAADPSGAYNTLVSLNRVMTEVDQRPSAG